MPRRRSAAGNSHFIVCRAILTENRIPLFLIALYCPPDEAPRRTRQEWLSQGKQVMSDFKLERANMVESQIRPNAVTDTELLKVLLETPRELFVPPSLRALAYLDGELRVEEARDHRPARNLLSPMAFAKLAQLARVRNGDRILDIGGATGYSAAILARLGASVVAVENDAGLIAVAKEALATLGIGNVSFTVGPMEAGAPEHAPYDVIFLNGRVSQLPDALLDQLSEGGRLVAPMGTAHATKGKLLSKIDSRIQERIGFDIGASPLPGFEPKKAFVF
jgi:protein-L-isoaspartate(D-aspartate) O-methyltransferase